MAAYISEVGITGDSSAEFVEIAVTQGTDTSGYTLVHYMDDGDGDAVVYKTYGLGSVETTISGQDVYTIDDSHADVSVETGDGSQGNFWPGDSLALVDGNGTVLQYVSFYGNTYEADGGPADGMASTMIGTPGFGESLQSDDGGATYYTQSSPNPDTIPCFATGTKILTGSGYRLVENLRLGELIETIDHGLQPIRLIRQYCVDLSELLDDQKPVRIKKGALGTNCPKATLTVSPQHRIVIGTMNQIPRASPEPVLVPAKALTGLTGISHKRGSTHQSYVHFAFDRHEVIIANGVQTESLLLSDRVMAGLPRLQRNGLKCKSKTHQKTRRSRAFLTVSQGRCLTRKREVA